MRDGCREYSELLLIVTLGMDICVYCLTYVTMMSNLGRYTLPSWERIKEYEIFSIVFIGPNASHCVFPVHYQYS